MGLRRPNALLFDPSLLQTPTAADVQPQAGLINEQLVGPPAPPLLPTPTPTTPPGLPPPAAARPAGLIKAPPKRTTTSQTRRTDTQRTGTRQASTVSQFLAPEEFEQLSNIADTLPELQNQKNSIEQLRGIQNSLLAQPVQTDISPLLALVDSQTGSNLLKGFKARDPQANIVAANKVGTQIRQAEQALSRNKTSVIRGLRSGQLQNILTGGSTLTNLAGLQQQRVTGLLASRGKTAFGQSAKVLDDAFDRLQRDKSFDAAKKRLNAARSAALLVTQGGPVATDAVKTVFPRLAGEVGNLAQAEQERFGGSQALVARINRFKERLLEGTLTPKDKRDMLEIAQVFKKNSEGIIRSSGDRFARQASISNPDLVSRSQVLDSFSLGPLLRDPQDVSDAFKNFRTQKTIQKKLGKLTEAQRKARLDELRKKQARGQVRGAQ